jgi:ribosomal protein S18 acetylase RimI-like enzyme
MITTRPVEPGDASWTSAFLDEHMGGRHQARRGELLDALSLPGLVAELDGEAAGLLTYRDEGNGSWELFCIVAARPGAGVGTALVDALRTTARAGGARRIWLVTTNDNQRAQRFYQRRGFRLCHLAPGGVDASRRVKATIPLTGHHGIPIRDELEFELVL